MTDRRVWVVSELYYPEESATGYLMTGLAEGLAARFPVRVLCAQPTYLMRGVRAPRREVRHGVDVLRCPSTTFDKDRLALRLINLVTVSLSIAAAALWQLRKGDCALVVTNPPLLPYLVMLACRLRGVRCVVRVDDVYPDVLAVAGGLDRRGILYGAMRRASAWLYRNAERVTVLGRDMAALVERRAGVNGRLRVIPNWAEVDRISPAPKANNALLQELGLGDKFVVQWAGSMGRPHEVASLLEAMLRLRAYPDVHFLFMGTGTKRAWLEAEVRRAGLENATFLGNRPRSDQQNFLNACDIALSSLVAGMCGISVPSRTYNILAAGKPILAIGDPDAEVARVVQEERVGWVVPPGEADRIAETVLQARDDPSGLEEMGRRARIAAETRYAFEVIVEQYVELIQNCLSR